MFGPVSEMVIWYLDLSRKTGPGWSKVTPSTSKIAPKRPQDIPRELQDGSKMVSKRHNVEPG